MSLCECFWCDIYVVLLIYCCCCDDGDYGVNMCVGLVG